MNISNQSNMPFISKNINMIDSGIFNTQGLIAYPFYWQLPAATEMAAYESITSQTLSESFEYIAFPWASLIDGLRGNSENVGQLLEALKNIGELSQNSFRRVTVMQHIHAIQFLDIIKYCCITDVFWSHAVNNQTEIDGIRIHPFPLFPAQTPNLNSLNEFKGNKKYLANFIGAYNPNIYISNVRDCIFNDRNPEGDLLIVKRDAWHFDRVVYEEQIEGRKSELEQLIEEEKRKQEYIDAIKDSWFTLCPTGSGPNSIRIFESLALGSIPIILSRDLKLPGPILLWSQACIIEEDSEDGYLIALIRARNMSLKERKLMIKNGSVLFEKISPKNYACLIKNAIN